MASKQEILAAARRVEKVEIPELGMPVFVRAMTGAEADTYQDALEKATNANSTVGLGRLLVSLTLCDETGKRLFATAAEIGEMDAAAISRIVAAAVRMSGLTKEFREELEKKVPKDSGGTGTP